ncbi:permease [Bifidobacterium choloepi]|uniref:Permease n=1 Tax=Bifidobacterium choloepi TaxID=2614131 RepID=A0A6I5MYZ9_9BIFI|nr:permease [Bifidobacterium choloepi]NEG69507.1 permease [Bifidobacterium choloepi]
MLKSYKGLIVAGLGVLVLFAAFLLYGTNANPNWGTIKLTDILTIIGGLMFIIPFYLGSVHAKTRDGAPNNWLWEGLPVAGMVLVCAGILIPNSVGVFSVMSLPDIMYLVGCLMMLPIFVYPIGSVNREMLEEDTTEIVDETTRK